MLPSNENEWQDIILGTLQVLFWNIFIMLFGITIPIIGIVQFLYVIPLAIHLKRKEKIGIVKGVIIGAIITILLNGGCWLWMLGYFN
ncbi:MAG TPA: hypothetical protein DEG17_00935 [Cyanobacteria bacterium UBA11149]|nr:hypothetical protein [Cyanobacteria bacterium UBA11367]HBE59094.1 hypothetical protein [Cyanobacteria bacterium UBA11366]HBK64120.1 hypothetical protein [Cyanobacteria bacterium UBA11166]HBR72774.1 hypothetical protein [Cyanobacteria bacterium UBA11159]HBS67952.1 hypothetical protein [Cyanobacteria bacterium UBA11153]HBW87478.1 hypothetical protein [Cyanobacteria bacterium UBA11149]HCA94060.1 hypothetical protein [Cyanobacteria bacterium UBA9226]